MLKKTITYENYDGETVSEDFFFHLSKAEMVELEMSHQGGMSAALQRIIDAEDGKGIVDEFKKIILAAYGVRSQDGKRFTKNQQVRDEFESTEAYSALFMELVTNTDAAIEFVNGIIPAGMAEEAAKLVQAEQTADVVPIKAPPEEVSAAQMHSMTQEQLEELGRRIGAGEVVLKP